MQEPNQSGSVVQSMRMSVGTQSIALFVANVIGAILYVFAASRGGWANPVERAEGIYTTTGEPLVWFINILPIVVIFFILNVAWTIILTRRQWRGGRFWLLAAVVWLAAIAIDFAHH
jgi:hypothetical protein